MILGASLTSLSAWLSLAAPLTGLPSQDSGKSGGARWGADYFPNVPLMSHEGKTVRFFDDLIRDKVVVINFIYTNCPDACPLETAKLTEVASLLGERMGQDVFFYSISIDPTRDTPEALKAYSERYETGPGWLFLTGKADDIKQIRTKLGMIAADEQSLQDHTLSLLIGNQASGQWMKRSPFENPYFLVSQLGSWLHNWKAAPEGDSDYSEAPKLRSISRGESLFRTRCSACHAIGPETDGIKRQGPNLLGVTDRREHAWLARWLAEPDAMLAEGDPLARELFEANRNLPMPNMRLNAIEVEALIEYMAEESAWYVESSTTAASESAEIQPPEPPKEELPACCQKVEGLILGDTLANPAPSASPAESVQARLELAPWPGLLKASPPETPLEVPSSSSFPRTALFVGTGLGLLLGLLATLLRGPETRF